MTPMKPSALRYGAERDFERKVEEAFRKGFSYVCRRGGVDFDGDTATIWVREAFNGTCMRKNCVHRFPVRMKWNKRTPVKAILAALVAGGYGEQANFQHSEPPPSPPGAEPPR